MQGQADPDLQLLLYREPGGLHARESKVFLARKYFSYTCITAFVLAMLIRKFVNS
jgi:hypothetical protein